MTNEQQDTRTLKARAQTIREMIADYVAGRRRAIKNGGSESTNEHKIRQQESVLRGVLLEIAKRNA
jgi:hypothetical protein